MMLKIGDKVIYKPIDYRDYSHDTQHWYYGTTATVLSEADFFNRVMIAFDDFPECNNKAQANRFYANLDELEKYE